VISAVILILNSPVENPVLQVQTRENAIPEAAVKASPSSDFYPPVLHSDGWNQPVPLEQTINTAGGEDSAFVVPDGNMLYFFFTPNVTVPLRNSCLMAQRGSMFQENKTVLGGLLKE
jgi:hypothetical protein